MLDINNKTIGDIFKEAATLWPNQIFFVSPKTNKTPLITVSYIEALNRMTEYKEELLNAGYGYGERIALLLGNRVEHYLIKLAANNLGISVVPINPNASSNEILYILNDSGAALTITDQTHLSLMESVAKIASSTIKFCDIDNSLQSFPTKTKNIIIKKVNPSNESSLLYTSGTTGNPKGCILSHEYELMCGDSYRSLGPPLQLRVNEDRIFNPLPSFHINAGILTFFASLLTGNCLIQPPRFSASTWWRDIEETKATVFHYLGVIIAIILKTMKETKADLNSVRVGLGAGVEPALHKEFEEHFKIPLIEVWGMTEMCRIIAVTEEPRLINTRAMGRPRGDLEIKVIDDSGNEVPIGSQGEMIIRHSKISPRKGAFSGYLGDEEATEFAWRGGWFHTGDIVTMDQTMMLYFIEREKNIIRRAGENIAAAEVENCILEHHLVLSVACLAVSDQIREEEVLACVVLSNKDFNTYKSAKKIFTHSYKKLAYFKAPGWILFVENLPTTDTQKILKHKIFAENECPTKRSDIFDFREFKKRKNQSETI